jgi:hypothetical protein
LKKEKAKMGMNKQHDNGSQGEDTEPKANLALVIRANISAMPLIVRQVEQSAQAKILYLKISGGRLRIEAEE